VSVLETYFIPLDYAARKAYMLATQEHLHSLRGIIYKITNKVNGKCYIGQTNNTFVSRYGISWWNKHRYHNEHFFRAINKYGHFNFIIEILIFNKCRSELNIWEDFYIRLYQSAKEKFGYNIKNGGDARNNKNTQKIELAAKARRMLLETFIQRANEIHNNKYDYSLFKIGWLKDKEKIYCRQCKLIFLQRRDKHLSGQGCPFCKKYKAIKKLNYMTLALITTYPSIKSAAESVMGFSPKAKKTNISRSCKNKIGKCYGFKWKYA